MSNTGQVSPAVLAVAINAAATVISVPPPPPASQLPPLAQFVGSVVARSKVGPNAVSVAVAYLERIRRTLPKSARGLPCSGHRLFLAALILSAKYINDKTYKNRSWVSFTEGLFPVSEINLMERQFLSIIDFDLHCHEEDHAQVMCAIRAFDSKIQGMMFSKQQPVRSDSATSFEPHSPPEFVSKPCPVLSQGYLPSPVAPSPLPLSMMTQSSASSAGVPRFHPYQLAAVHNKRLVSPSVSPSAPAQF
ncbi:hypothetical protein CcCBS67573_g02416 [Chytriomyces confervae]|uniref:Cyclin N-terminal domain-containing protein n=1 Tax=Chytriomyces confervae TaxID=246404 RepID=A0A507FLT5_9FUNG|nr:hypothetical protein HDU80_006651 [Chytriomyces hyalinus]TPX76286.1 hypothetical protein CcCBS67573_g02416 [Chytriomyces confervae]